MAFTPRTRAQIAAEFLAYWSANYAAASPPRVLLTASGSDADLEAQVVGVELEGLEAVAAQVAALLSFCRAGEVSTIGWRAKVSLHTTLLRGCVHPKWPSLCPKPWESMKPCNWQNTLKKQMTPG